MKLPKIGMRTIKTGIAAFICACVATTGIINNPFFAIGACVVSMQNTIKDSYIAGFSRIKGTLIGGIFGFLVVYAFGHNIFIASIGIIFAIYCCNLLKEQSSIPVCVITYASIAYTITTQNPFIYSFHRTLDTTFGVIIGVLVNYTISKPNLLNDIISQIERFRDLSFHIVRNNLLSENIDLVDYENKLYNLIDLLSKHKEEFYSDKNSNDFFEFDKMIMKFKEIRIHLYCLKKIEKDFIISEENLEHLNFLFGLEVINKINSSQNNNHNIHHDNIEISAVYNYHLHEILTSLDEIDSWILFHSKKKTIL